MKKRKKKKEREKEREVIQNNTESKIEIKFFWSSGRFL